jgi:predicted MPP superfamily phosphohydrolase
VTLYHTLYFSLKNVIILKKRMKHNFITPFNHHTQINRVEFTIPKFQDKNYKIAQISDVHIGYYLGEKFLDDLVNKIINLNPNICVITGDLIASHKDFTTDILTPLKKLTAKIDTYFVLGNHEVGRYKFRVEEFLSELRALGIHTLHNESTTVHSKNFKFNMVGIGEKIASQYNAPVDIKKSFSNIDRSLETIVLVHRPNTVKYFKDYPFILALSGHNHGGQLTKLGLISSILRKEGTYLTGKIVLEKNKFIYVTSGVGYSRIPLRLFAPSEIALVVINGTETS